MPASTSTLVHRLRLASHVRACHSDGQVILLDLRRNKYLGIGGPYLPALASAISGWPACPPAEPIPDTLVDVDALTRPLLSQGLLTSQPGEPQDTGLLEEAISSLNAGDALQGASAGPRRVLRLVRSAATAAAWLRWRSLLWTAEAVTARRMRLQAGVRLPATADAMHESVAAYEKLRPLVYTSQDRCLHDSLALVGFLAHEGIFPRWVIGVQTRPFAAHSWVQSGGLVLNDQHDRVRRFRPILVI